MPLTNICIISTIIPPDFTGAGIRAFNHAKWLARSGTKVTVLTTSKNTENIENLEVVTLKLPAGFNCNKITLVLFFPVLFFNSYKVLRKMRPQFSHSFGFESWFTITMVLTCKILNIRTIVESTLVGLDDPITIKGSSLGWLKYFIFSSANKIVNLSPIGLIKCKEAGINDNKIELIPNSINPKVFCTISNNEKEEKRKEFQLPYQDIVFVTVGAVVPRKGIRDIIEIFSKVQSRIKNSLLIIVGPINLDTENLQYYNSMKEYVKKLDLGNNVIFTGNVTNVNEWLQISDLFLFASKKEGFPSVIIQAMATGLPVISLPLPNIIEFIIENQKSGIIIDNIENAVQTALRLVNNVSEYKRISLNAIKRVHECFTDEIIMSAYHNLYDSI